MIASNKIRAVCILAVTVGIIIAAFLLPPEFSKTELMAFLMKLISHTTTISLVLIFVFDKWLWKIFPEWFLGIPKVYGTWKGKLEHTQITDASTKQEGVVAPFFLCIRQTFCSMVIHALSEQSDSVSTISSLKKGPIVWEIIYAYDNAPALQHQTNSRRHRGAATIQIQPTDKGRKLVGEYWTDRWSQGRITLEKRSTKIATDFVAAKKVH